MAYYGGGAAGAAYAAMVQAIKASGSIVRVEPDAFTCIISKSTRPLVVVARGGLIKKHFEYLTGYKGLTFFTKSPAELHLSGDTEIVHAGKIWIPG